MDTSRSSRPAPVVDEESILRKINVVLEGIVRLSACSEEILAAADFCDDGNFRRIDRSYSGKRCRPFHLHPLLD